MAVSSFPSLYSLKISNNSSNHVLSSSSSSTGPLFKVNARPSRSPRPSTIIVFSSRKSGNGTGTVSEEAKRVLRDRYGFNPDELLSDEPSPKTGRRKQLKNAGKGKQDAAEEDRKPPRTTHKLLQVLGGKARRRKLLSPKGMDVRPMMEVVKGAAFDIIQAVGGNPTSLRPGRWLDLYSGTGSVGIEAISRGCSQVHFVEMDPWVVTNVLRPNLEWTGFLDASVIHTVRVENFLERSAQFVGESGPFDYISVTPPYTQVDYGVLMGQISNSSLVGEDTFIVVEYPLRTDMFESCGCLVKITDRRFGRTHLAIYGPKWAEKKRKSEISLGNIAVQVLIADLNSKDVEQFKYEKIASNLVC